MLLKILYIARELRVLEIVIPPLSAHWNFWIANIVILRYDVKAPSAHSAPATRRRPRRVRTRIRDSASTGTPWTSNPEFKFQARI